MIQLLTVEYYRGCCIEDILRNIERKSETKNENKNFKVEMEKEYSNVRPNFCENVSFSFGKNRNVYLDLINV